MTIALANAVLASMVVVPTVLWIFDSRLTDLYQLPNGNLHPVFAVVSWLPVVAAIAEIGFQVQILGESEMRFF